MKRVRFLALWLCVFFACTPEKGPTQIVIRVDTDFAIPAAINEVQFEVYRERPEDGWFLPVDLLGEQAVPLPLTLALTLQTRDPGPFTITVSGQLRTNGQPSKVVVRRTARVSFQRGRIMLLNMDLLTACGEVFEHCEDLEQTCVSGSCERPEDAVLEPWTGDTPRTLPDGSIDIVDPDRPAGDDASARDPLDGGDARDGGPSIEPDAAAPDAGEPLVPEPEGDYPVQLALGEHFSCARMKQGSVYCWGQNDLGQIGDDTTKHNGPCATLDCTPTPRLARLEEAATDLAAGAISVCAVHEPSAFGDNLKCWGDTAFAPKSVKDDGTNVANAQQASVGGDHACFLSGAKQVRCWGDRAYGQLGNGQVSFSPDPEPQLVTAYDALLTSSGATPDMIRAGGTHTCARAGGAILCWGENTFRACGVADDDNLPSANKVSITGVAQALAAGKRHNCAIVAGDVECWGANEFGQLGHDDSEDVCESRVCSATPKPITAPFEAAKATGITAGDAVSCALRSDGQVLCWGDNEHGQLGRSNVSESSSPVAVLSGTEPIVAKQVVAGETHVCAIRAEPREVVCWGSNTAGELGPNGTVGTRSLVPLVVALPPP